MKRQRTLQVIATELASVREVDENGQVLLGNVRIIGKRFNPDTQLFEATGEIVVVPCNYHYINLVREGSLIPADVETARIAGLL